MFSPYNSDGHLRRFKQFESFFHINEIRVKIKGLINDREFHEFNNSNTMARKYRFYIKIAFIRASQLPSAIFYKNVLVQRILLPFYPDYNSLFFERLLTLLGANRILDIWDPIHIWHPDKTYNSFKYYNKLTVNTKLLKDDYSCYFEKDKIILWPIAVNDGLYERKHRNLDSINLFYTGSKGNTISYLEPLIPLLEDISSRQNIVLHVIGDYSPSSDKLKIEHLKWSEENIKRKIEQCDYGLYPNFQTEKTKNYTVAGKVLDYMMAKLPIIGANQGLPEGIDPNKAIFILDSLTDWRNKLEEVLILNSEAQKKADYSFEFIRDNLAIDKIGKSFKEEVLELN